MHRDVDIFDNFTHLGETLHDYVIAMHAAHNKKLDEPISETFINSINTVSQNIHEVVTHYREEIEGQQPGSALYRASAKESIVANCTNLVRVCEKLSAIIQEHDAGMATSSKGKTPPVGYVNLMLLQMTEIYKTMVRLSHDLSRSRHKKKTDQPVKIRIQEK